MTKLIVAEPFTGLGNRLQCIGSLKRIASIHGCEFAVGWPINPACAAFFQDLYEEPINQISLRLNAVPKEFSTQIKEKQILLLKPGIESDVIRKSYFDYAIIHPQAAHLYVLETSSGGKENRADVIREVGDILRDFRLNKSVSRRLDVFTKEFDVRNRVGVHVRRGDAPLHRQVALQRYFDRISDEYQREALLIASDDEGVIAAFNERFGSRAISYAVRNRQRDGRFAVQDAFVELQLLSRTKRIIGGMSSFARIAAMIGGIEMDVLRDDAQKSKTMRA